MSSKFKPTKKKDLEGVVDDWEASDQEEDSKEEIQQSAQSYGGKEGSRATSMTSKGPHQDAWGDEMTVYDRGTIGAASSVRQDGRTLWQEANRAEPQPQPVLINRSLPSTVLSPRLYSTASSTGEHSQSTAPPPPQILRREKVGFGKVTNENGNEKKKSLKEREEEYRKARERIFGPITPSASPPPSQGKGRGQGNGQQQQKKPQAPRAK